MKIVIKHNAAFKDVKVRVNDTTIDLGLLDDDKCMELAKMLDYAVYRLIGKENYIKLKDDV